MTPIRDVITCYSCCKCHVRITLCKLDLSIRPHLTEALQPNGQDSRKLSWKETYEAMAAANEDWSDLDIAVADGFD